MKNRNGLWKGKRSPENPLFRRYHKSLRSWRFRRGGEDGGEQSLLEAISEGGQGGSNSTQLSLMVMMTCV